jgi:hypothetical protein
VGREKMVLGYRCGKENKMVLGYRCGKGKKWF